MLDLSHILSSLLGFEEFMMVAKITSCDKHCGCALIRKNYIVLIDWNFSCACEWQKINWNYLNRPSYNFLHIITSETLTARFENGGALGLHAYASFNGSRWFRCVNLKVFILKIISNLCGLRPVFITEQYFFVIIIY